MQRLVLIDGNAIVHRAYHALPPLTSSTGEVANAVYGFFSMLLKILEDIKPEYLAVCFDRQAPTFRQTLYVGYQQHRPKTADDLIPQFAIIHDILEKSGAQIFEVDGYEADDLIGTIAKRTIEEKWEVGNAKLDKEMRSEKKSHLSHRFPVSHVSPLTSNIEVIIVSGDRDFLQLVNGHVRVIAPIVGITNMTIFDADKVKEKYGLEPSQFIDYKALVGDASDGYPGVTGVGPKTASTLLNKYKTFEGVYQHLGELSAKLSQALATDAEQASLAKKLATIVTDAPIQFDIQKCSMNDFDMTILKQEFERLGFKSLVKRLQGGSGELGEREKQETHSSQSSSGQVKKKKKQTLSDQLGLL